MSILIKKKNTDNNNNNKKPLEAHIRIKRYPIIKQIQRLQ